MPDTRPTVLVTGATSGLGRYLALELARSGWQVLAHGRDRARVADLSAELDALGGGTPTAGRSSRSPRSPSTWPTSSNRPRSR